MFLDLAQVSRKDNFGELSGKLNLYFFPSKLTNQNFTLFTNFEIVIKM